MTLTMKKYKENEKLQPKMPVTPQILKFALIAEGPEVVLLLPLSHGLCTLCFNSHSIKNTVRPTLKHKIIAPK